MPETHDPQIGDLVFQNGRHDGRPGHVGIYDPFTGTVVHLSREVGCVEEREIDKMPSIMVFRSIEPWVVEYERQQRLRRNARLAL